METYFALFIFLDFCTVCLAWIQLGIKFCLLKFFRHLAELAVKDHKKIFLLVLPWYSWHVEHLIFAEEPKFSGLVNLSRQLARDMPFPTWKKCNVLLLIRNWEVFKFVKVYIFWEGHKILRNLHLTFDYSTYSQKLGEDFAKFCDLLRIYEL